MAEKIHHHLNLHKISVIEHNNADRLANRFRQQLLPSKDLTKLKNCDLYQRIYQIFMKDTDEFFYHFDIEYIDTNIGNQFLPYSVKA